MEAKRPRFRIIGLGKTLKRKKMHKFGLFMAFSETSSYLYIRIKISEWKKGPL